MQKGGKRGNKKKKEGPSTLNLCVFAPVKITTT